MPTDRKATIQFTKCQQKNTNLKIMTENEFNKQVWRPYDTVTLNNGVQGTVGMVSFLTKSVRIKFASDSIGWFRCEEIESHKSVTGCPDDIAIIKKLQQQVQEMGERNARLVKNNQDLMNSNASLKQTNAELREEGKTREDILPTILKKLNEIDSCLKLKKARVEKIEGCVEALNDILRKGGDQ